MLKLGWLDGGFFAVSWNGELGCIWFPVLPALGLAGEDVEWERRKKTCANERMEMMRRVSRMRMCGSQQT